MIAETTVSAPTTAALTGTNAAIRSTADDGGYLGFGHQRLRNAGYSPAPGTQPFSLTYDGSTFIFTAGGVSVTTSGVAVEDDALTVQVKKADAAVTTASVSNLQVDGASVGSPDGVSAHRRVRSPLVPITDTTPFGKRCRPCAGQATG